MKPGPETPLPRGWRLRIVGFAVAAVAIAGLLYAGQDFLATLQRLDVVERERDVWQPPGPDPSRSWMLGPQGEDHQKLARQLFT